MITDEKVVEPMKLRGLSTDTKPTTIGDMVGNYDLTALPNGSEFLEIDTHTVFYYDADGKAWN